MSVAKVVVWQRSLGDCSSIFTVCFFLLGFCFFKEEMRYISENISIANGGIKKSVLWDSLKKDSFDFFTDHFYAFSD